MFGRTRLTCGNHWRAASHLLTSIRDASGTDRTDNIVCVMRKLFEETWEYTRDVRRRNNFCAILLKTRYRYGREWENIVMYFLKCTAHDTWREKTGLFLLQNGNNSNLRFDIAIDSFDIAGGSRTGWPVRDSRPAGSGNRVEKRTAIFFFHFCIFYFLLLLLRIN